jgi:hypothetical protein
MWPGPPSLPRLLLLLLLFLLLILLPQYASKHVARTKKNYKAVEFELVSRAELVCRSCALR